MCWWSLVMVSCATKNGWPDLARHIATWGLDVATLDFRHSRLWAGHHDQNAADMVALVRHLNAKRVIYAGFSAGGLSALLAAASDPASIGYLGLDTVDDGSGAKAALGDARE